MTSPTSRSITPRNIAVTYIIIVMAAVIDAIGVIVFLVPAKVAPGGVSGIAVILNHLNPALPIGLMIIIGNIPVQLLGARYLGGWRVVVRTVVYIILYSLLVDLLQPQLATVDVGNNTLTNALFGGIVSGIAGGLVLRAGGTQGGTSTLGRILQFQFGMPLSTSALYTDAAVVLLAGLVFGWEGALYALVALFVGGLAADYVLEGPSTIRTTTIITDRPDDISNLVLDEMGRGVTAWPGKGMFTDETHTVLFITVSRSQINELRRLVHIADPDAFLVVGQGHVAYGEGFRRVRKP
jgi:uncharacterized membrane-anchored protein YitT (DUF2179 family)